MEQYVLISMYNDKLSFISESLGWCSLEKAAKFTTLVEAESFFKSIPQDISGYFSIGEILENRTILDLKYRWHQTASHIYLYKGNDIIQQTECNNTPSEIEPEIMNRVIRLFGCGVSLIDKMQEDFWHLENNNKSDN